MLLVGKGGRSLQITAQYQRGKKEWEYGKMVYGNHMKRGVGIDMTGLWILPHSLHADRPARGAVFAGASGDLIGRTGETKPIRQERVFRQFAR